MSDKKGRGPTVRPNKLFAPTSKKMGDVCQVDFKWNDADGASRTTSFLVSIGKDTEGNQQLVSARMGAKPKVGE